MMSDRKMKRRYNNNTAIGAIVVSRYTRSIGVVVNVIENLQAKHRKLILVKWQNMVEQTCEDPSDTLSINEA
jgi:hypothetical protein